MSDILKEINQIRNKYGALLFVEAIITCCLLIVLLHPLLVVYYGFKLGWKFSEKVVAL
jgi:hypothetical protein